MATMPMTDNANYHALTRIAYREGYAAHRPGLRLRAWQDNPYNPHSPMAVAWHRGLDQADLDALKARP